MSRKEDHPKAMGGKPHKVQMTVRLKPEVYRRAREIERRTGTPVSVVVSDAAEAALVPRSEESAETKLQNLSNRLLSRLQTLERDLGGELMTTNELLAQFVRAYFNHTAEVPDSEREAASTSGRLRFVNLLKRVKVNIRMGVSILNDAEVSDGN